MRKKLLILLIPLVVLLICSLTTLGILYFKPSDKVYTQNIESAKKSLEDNDIDAAIVYYRAAIEADDTQEEAYLQLARIYYEEKGDISEAIAILTEADEKIGSEGIKNALWEYLQRQPGGAPDRGDEKTESAGSDNIGRFNTSIIEKFRTYTFKDYRNNYSIEKETPAGDVYSIKYLNLGAEFMYINTASGKVWDPRKGKPEDDAKPSEIRVTDISQIISIDDNGVPSDVLRSRGVIGLQKEFDSTQNTNVVRFEYMNCIFRLPCDENGTVKKGSEYGVIIPPASNGSNDSDTDTDTDTDTEEYEEEVPVTVSGVVRNSVNANPVSGASIVVRRGVNVTSGDTETNAITGSDGSYSFEVVPGEYTLEVKCDGFSTECFVITVLKDTPLTSDFTISPTLATGEIRIVLEWDATPTDLDSHLSGTSGDNVYVNVFFRNKVARSGSDVIATLDVDDIDSFGPETITLYDMAGTYTYSVHQYSYDGSLATSGATVKVYTDNNTSPLVIEVPSSVSGDWWDVFKIENGQIVDINGNVTSR